MTDDEAGSAPPPWRTTILLGHQAAEERLLAAYRTGRLHHAWLLAGPPGIGKATLAWRFARFVLANPEASVPAVQRAATLAVSTDAPAALKVAAGSHGDVVALRREWNDKTKKLYAEIRVDDVRRALGLFQSASGAGGYRICIIDTADDLNRSSANALLKVIEEPPPRSVFLILAHRPGSVMPTLVSRCRRLMLKSLDPTDIAAGLRGFGAVGDDALIGAVAARAGGSLAEALRLLDTDAQGLDAAVQAVLAPLPAVDWLSVHRLADAIGTSDERFTRAVEIVFDDLSQRLRQGAVERRPADALARLASAWERVRAVAREASVLNLDRRPALFSIMEALAGAALPGQAAPPRASAGF